MINFKNIKYEILERAIRGKFVEHRQEDGTAEDLLLKVANEKNKLVSEKKIKSPKQYGSISVDEIPFSIPSSWKWVRIGDLVYNHGQKTPNHTISYIDIGSIDNNKQTLGVEEHIVNVADIPSRARKIVKEKDILYSTVRPYLHNMCIVDKKFSYEPIASTGFVVLSCHEGVFYKYLFYYLLSPTFDKYANDMGNSRGVSYPAINEDRLLKAVIAVPPLGEQKRIADKIERSFKLIDSIEDDVDKFQENQNIFFTNLIELGLRGKLTSFNGRGENIQTKCSVSNIKKDGPFDIPGNWKWVTLSSCYTVIGSKKYQININQVSSNGRYPVVSQGQKFIEGYCDDSSKLLNKLPIILFGDHTKQVKFLDFPFVVGADGTKLLYTESVEPKYLYYCVKYLADNLRDRGYARNYSQIKDSLIPLPPFEEQKRIVEEIEKFRPLCKNIIL